MDLPGCLLDAGGHGGFISSLELDDLEMGITCCALQVSSRDECAHISNFREQLRSAATVRVAMNIAFPTPEFRIM